MGQQWFKYKNKTTDVERICRYLDKLYKNQKEQIQEISYLHTLQVLSGKMSVVFYDVTTLYFESSQGDELRKTGFSAMNLWVKGKVLMRQ